MRSELRTIPQGRERPDVRFSGKADQYSEISKHTSTNRSRPGSCRMSKARSQYASADMGDRHERRGALPNANASPVCRERSSRGLTLDPGESRADSCRLERAEPALSSDEPGWTRKGRVVHDGYLLDENRRLQEERISGEYTEC
jgi:hypothetical protein